jgi:hypothetical protein
MDWVVIFLGILAFSSLVLLVIVLIAVVVVLRIIRRVTKGARMIGVLRNLPWGALILEQIASWLSRKR